MKDFKKTLFMKEASKGRGHSIFVEMVIALVLFFIASVAMGIAQIPVLAVYLINNKDYMSMLVSGKIDNEKLAYVMSNMPEWVMIDMLFAEILLTLVVLLYCRFFEKRRLSTLGFVKKGMVKQYALGLCAGAAAFSAVYLICVVTGSVKFEGIAANITPLYIAGFFFGYVLQGMAEEVLCRGYLMVSLSRRYHVTLAIIYSSLFFAFLHGANNGFSMLAFINLFLFGVFASLLLLDSGNIWIAGAFHSIWNFVQGNIYGIQVSGTSVSSSVFSTANTDGMEIINGGSFGMEGGLAVTFVLATGISLLAFHLYKKGNIIDVSERQEFAELAGDMPYHQDVVQEIQDTVIDESTVNSVSCNAGTDSTDAVIYGADSDMPDSTNSGTDNTDSGSSAKHTLFDENYFN